MTGTPAGLRFVPDPQLRITDDAGEVVARHPGGRLRWPAPAPALRDGLLALGTGPTDWDDLLEKPDDELPGALNLLLRRGLLQLRLTDDAGLVAEAGPVGILADLDLAAATGPGPFRLSRFAVLHRDGDHLVADLGLRSLRVVIRRGWAAGLLAESVDLSSGAPQHLRAAVRLFAAAGLLLPVDAAGRTVEDRDPVLRQRTGLDVALHARSRRGLAPGRVGATYRFQGELPPPPALRPAEPRIDEIELPDAEPDDVPLHQVMQERRSRRAWDDEHPVTLAQIGGLLHLTARAASVNTVDATAGRMYESTRRLPPSGGAMHDIELYLTVRRCDGLAPGLYRYEPLRHTLTPLECAPAVRDRLLADAAASAGVEAAPQVLVSMAARFTRMSWKYEGMAYATTLKNVGVLYEAIYLAATALRLSVCGLGAGDSAVFAVATGLDPAEESTVGEMMLGSLPPT